jgi:hypothetical protein
MQEFRLSYDSHDAWGCTMSAMFAVAAEMYYRDIISR